MNSSVYLFEILLSEKGIVKRKGRLKRRFRTRFFRNRTNCLQKRHRKGILLIKGAEPLDFTTREGTDPVMKKRVFSILLILALLAALTGVGCQIGGPDPSKSSGVPGEPVETESETEAAPKTYQFAEHIGEATETPDLYLVDFKQLLTGYTRVLYTDYYDGRMLLSLLANNSLVAAEYDFTYGKWRTQDLRIPVARFFYMNEAGERVLLGYEEKYVRFCGPDRYVYCYDGELKFYDQDFRELYTEEGMYENPVFGDGFFAYAENGTAKIVLPDGTGYQWSAAGTEVTGLSALSGNALFAELRDRFGHIKFELLEVPGTVTGRTGWLWPENRIEVAAVLRNAAGGDENPEASSAGNGTDALETLRIYRKTETGTAVFSFDSDAGKLYQTGADEEMLAFLEDGFLTREKTETGVILRFYETGTAAAVSTLSFPGTAENPAKVDKVLPFEGGLILTDSFGEEETRVYVWTPSGTASEDPAETVLADNPGGSGLGKFGNTEYYSEKDYTDASFVYTENTALGIGLYYGDRVPERDYPDYAVVPCMDEELAATRIQEIEAVFSKMPGGFLDEVIEGFDGLNIVLADDIQTKGGVGDGVLKAAAFTIMTGRRAEIILNVNYPDMTTNLAHEFMHVIDRALANRTDAPDAFADWETLNPVNFRYYYSYYDPNGNSVTEETSPAYTPADANAPDAPEVVWFADAYSKTYPMEDRARLFEFLFSGDAPDMYCYYSSHVRAKVRCLISELRKYFPSLEDAEEIPWEAFPGTWE